MMYRFSFFSLLLLAGGAIGTLSANEYKIVKNADGAYVANLNFLVQAEEGVTSSELASKLSVLDATIVHEYNNNDVYLVRLMSGDPDENLEALKSVSGVKDAHFDWAIFPNFYTPTEALFSSQWALSQAGGSVSNINAQEAWSMTRGSGNDGILILDSGWPNAGHGDWDDTEWTLKLPATNATGSPINFASSVYGTPYEADEDELGHATAIGGIIAGEHDGVDLCGVAPDNYVICANIFFRWDEDGCERPAGLISDALSALEWLYDSWNANPAYGLRGQLQLGEVKIVNASWSYYRPGV